MASLSGTGDPDDTTTTTSRHDTVDTEPQQLIVVSTSLASILGNMRRVFRQIWHLALGLVCVFWVTLALFPGITSRLVSTQADMNLYDPVTNPTGSGWFAILMIFVFDLGDLVGRALPNLQAWADASFLSVRATLIGVGLRFLFFPLFVFAVGHPPNDFWSYLLMTLFSWTNGIYATRLMMLASATVEPKDKEYAGVLMIFHLTLGLFVGVWTGMALSNIV